MAHLSLKAQKKAMKVTLTVGLLSFLKIGYAKMQHLIV